MRIDPKLTAVTPVTMKSVEKTASVTTSERSSEPASVVSLSKAGAAAMADAKPVDSAEKVARLRAMIEKGDYHPDLDLLASRIVEDDLAGGVQ